MSTSTMCTRCGPSALRVCERRGREEGAGRGAPWRVARGANAHVGVQGQAPGTTGRGRAFCPPFLPPSPHVLPNVLTSAMHAPGQKVREDEDEDE